MDIYNILIVDDDVSNVNALKRALRREYNVLSATNGEDALAVMGQNEVDLIIADHRMPGMTGIELLERTLQKYPSVVRVILTSYTDEKLLMDAINRVHAHGFLPKPWEPEEIHSIVEKCIASYREDQQKELVEEKQEQLGKDMEDEGKTREQLVEELLELRRRVAESEAKREEMKEKRSWWRRLFRKGRARETR